MVHCVVPGVQSLDALGFRVETFASYPKIYKVSFFCCVVSRRLLILPIHPFYPKPSKQRVRSSVWCVRSSVFVRETREMKRQEERKRKGDRQSTVDSKPALCSFSFFLPCHLSASLLLPASLALHRSANARPRWFSGCLRLIVVGRCYLYRGSSGCSYFLFSAVLVLWSFALVRRAPASQYLQGWQALPSRCLHLG